MTAVNEGGVLNAPITMVELFADSITEFVIAAVDDPMTAVLPETKFSLHVVLVLRMPVAYPISTF